MRSRPSETVLDQFWSPVLKGASPVSLCVAYVPVYGLNRAGRSQRPDLLLTDQFVGGGDLKATSRLSAMLTRMQRPYN